MEPQVESEPSSLRGNLITVDRPDTAQIVDLHVYVIPTSVWQEQKNLAENDAIEQAISAGFVRVPQNLTIYDLRRHITDICGQEDGFPKDFIYLRSVGRCLAKVRPQQELELKVKNYRPPITYAPEIYVLEGHHDDDSSLASKSKSSLSHASSPQSTSSTATTSRQESWAKSTGESPPPIATLNPSFVHSSSEQQNSTILDRSATSSTSTLSRASSTLSARDLAKLREEQERLRLRQIELARQRREIEEEQQRRKTTGSTQSDDSKTETRKVELPTRDIDAEKLKAAKEQEEQQRRRRELEVEAQKAALQREEQKRKTEQEKRQREIEQENTLSKLERQNQEEEAATRIQASFRGYQSRQKTKKQKRHDHANDTDNDKQSDDAADRLMQRTYRIQIYDNTDI